MRDAEEVWRGEVDGETVRVLRVAHDDCLAEVLVVRSDDSRMLSVDRDSYSVDKDGAWAPSSDETASHAYVAALLAADRVLRAVQAAGRLGLSGDAVRYAEDGWRKEGSSELLTEPITGKRVRT